MTTTLKPLGPVERAVLQLVKNLPLEEPVADGWLGGDFAFDPNTMPWYIRVDKVTSNAGQLQGTVVVDLEVFSQDYSVADSLASALEALVLGYPHVVEVDGQKVVFDQVFQNEGPSELPWSDDSTYRIGATYAITVRRKG